MLSGLEAGDHHEVVKTRDNAFFRTRLPDELRELGVSHLLICGVLTHRRTGQPPR